MRILLLTAMLLVSACTPVSKSRPLSTMSDAEVGALVVVAAKDSCIAAGHEWKRVGKLQAPRCIFTYADAGKACTDGSQCLGKRCTGDFEDMPAASPATGTCAATNNPFGCNTIVEAGVARTICVD